MLNTLINSVTTTVLTLKFSHQMQHSNGTDKKKGHFNRAFQQQTLDRTDQQGWQHCSSKQQIT